MKRFLSSNDAFVTYTHATRSCNRNLLWKRFVKWNANWCQMWMIHRCDAMSCHATAVFLFMIGIFNFLITFVGNFFSHNYSSVQPTIRVLCSQAGKKNMNEFPSSSLFLTLAILCGCFILDLALNCTFHLPDPN